MATHSSVLAWRIPGAGGPGGLPSMGSHRVGHDCSHLAAAAAFLLNFTVLCFTGIAFFVVVVVVVVVFTNGRFWATLPQVNLLTSFFQQHLLTLCVTFR